MINLGICSIILGSPDETIILTDMDNGKKEKKTSTCHTFSSAQLISIRTCSTERNQQKHAKIRIHKAQASDHIPNINLQHLYLEKKNPKQSIEIHLNSGSNIRSSHKPAAPFLVHRQMLT